MNNSEIALRLEEIAFFLEMKGESKARIQIFQRAAKSVREAEMSLSQMLLNGDDLTQLRGINPVLAKKIEDMIILGHCEIYLQLLREFPKSLLSLRNVEGLTTAHIATLFTQHHIQSKDDLARELTRNTPLDLPPAALRRVREHFKRCD